MRRLGIIMLILGLISFLGMVFVVAQEGGAKAGIVKESAKEAEDDASDQQVLAAAKISLADAQATALQNVSGTVVKSELENEDGTPVYSFEIQTSADNTVEVKVDAVTGAFLGIEKDDGDDNEQDGVDNEQEGEHEHED